MKNLTLLIALLIFFLLLSCQNNKNEEAPESSYLKEVSIDSELHLDHVRQVTFMEEYVALSDYGKRHMIPSFNLPLNGQDKLDLNIRVFLKNTLTNYLLQLAPNKSISEIVSNGNYQFTFIIDDKKIYTENLHPGAGTPFTKNQYTSLCIPLLSSTKKDSWGRFMWARFMTRGGGQEAMTKGKHQLKIEIRPYVEFDKTIVGNIIAEGSISLNVIDNDTPISSEKVQVQNITASADWNISNEKISGKIIEKLNEKIYNNQFKKVTSIVVIKNNDLVLEEYFNEYTRESIHDTRSVGKSITSAILGIAIADGYIENEESKLKKFYDFNQFDNHSEVKENTTLKELLTMTSSFAGSDENSESKGSEDNIQKSKNWMDYTLSLTTINTGAKKWTYFTGGVMILGDIINKSVPDGIKEYTQQRLFGPLNIRSSKWFHTPQGSPYGGGGLQLTSLDYAKIGSLYINDGKWKEKQILTKNWVEKSLTNHVSLPKYRGGSYGYLWYNSSLTLNGKDISYSYAAGNGGNVIYIFRELQIVIVITAKAYNTMVGAVQGKKMVEQYILPALI